MKLRVTGPLCVRASSEAESYDPSVRMTSLPRSRTFPASSGLETRNRQEGVKVTAAFSEERSHPGGQNGERVNNSSDHTRGTVTWMWQEHLPVRDGGRG